MKRYFLTTVFTGFTICAVGFGLSLPGCTNTPLQTATQATAVNKPSVLGFALYSSYIVVAEKALQIAQDLTTPLGVKQAITQSYEKTVKPMEDLRAAAQAYETITAAIPPDGTTPEKIAAALLSLNQALAIASPALNDLANLVHGAKS